MSFLQEEMLSAYKKLVATRTRIEQGELPWSALAEHFTNDATFIDPAWGRVKGIDAIAEFMEESMAGLEGWTFPCEFIAVDGDKVISGWQNRLPGARPDGSPYQALGISVMIYAGNDKFSMEEDILNMRHVEALIIESGWLPGAGFNMPPENPPR